MDLGALWLVERGLGYINEIRNKKGVVVITNCADLHVFPEGSGLQLGVARRKILIDQGSTLGLL